MNFVKNCSRIIVLIFIGIGLSQCDDPAGTGGDGNNFSFSHIRQPGSSAEHFLSDSTFTQLTIEVDYMPGYKPTDEAIQQLKTFVQQRIYKPDGIDIEVSASAIASADQAEYTASEVRSLEEEHRDTFSEEGHLVGYMLIVDGRFEQQNVLGIAYYNTSTAFFGPAYDENSGDAGQPGRSMLESMSFRHEFGHIFGLVDGGTPMQTDHQDEENGHHCDNDECLMYYAVETTDYVSNLFGGSIPELDQNCTTDLAANGGK